MDEKTGAAEMRKKQDLLNTLPLLCDMVRSYVATLLLSLYFTHTFLLSSSPQILCIGEEMVSRIDVHHPEAYLCLCPGSWSNCKPR